MFGGSIEDNLFQVPDAEQQLKRLDSLGGNYIRNTMSSRDPGNLWPFHLQADSLYDLNRFNEAYFDRFEKALRVAYRHDIIVQIELWDRFDFARDPWLVNPFRPANNINYTVAESGLENQYPDHPGSNANPFFRSVPRQDHNRLVLAIQESLVRRMLEISLNYPNVLYTMDNETRSHPDWGAYWATFIKDEAQKKGITIYVTEMWDDWDLRGEEHRRTLDHPEIYDFADISQNNHQKGQQHWDNLQWVRRYTARHPRPLNNVKIYGADGGRYGTTQDALERFWQNLLGGSASARFHRPASGIGLGEIAAAHIQCARAFVARFNLFEARPDTNSHLLQDRLPNEAYLSYIPDRQYAIYFTQGGTVGLDLRAATGSFRLTWLNLATGQWERATPVQGGAPVSLEAPGGGSWIALVEKPGISNQRKPG